MDILSRRLEAFGVELIWNGKAVRSVDISRRTHVLEEYEVSDLLSATELMKRIEREYHDACVGMC